MNPICEQCRGACCSYTTLRIIFASWRSDHSLDRFLNEHEDLNQLLLEDGAPPDMEWCMVTQGDERSLMFHCNHRTPTGKCGVYENRPSMCRTFECSALEGAESLEEFLSRAPPRVFPRGRVVTVTDRVNQRLEAIAGGDA